MSSSTTIQTFFTGKTFVIPSFQRDYAWKVRNIDDLFDDVEEAQEVDGGHYLGTFILSRQDRAETVQVVDGQQRLTTLTILLDALIDAVDDINIKQHYRNTFISNPVTGDKFRVLGDNEAFFRDLLAEKSPEPQSDGQKRLFTAHRHIRLRVNALLERGGQPLINSWLLCLSNMEVLEFVEPNEGKAIRMFQSVNDRGVPLAKMDIVKSLLVYYSNRYLDGQLDKSISQQFGQAFRSFSRLKHLAGEPGYKIRQVDRDVFKEDDVLRYHYLAFNAAPFGVVVRAGTDFTATSETVLDAFLKPALQQLRSDPVKLRAFIEAYTSDLTAFFAGLEQLIQATRTDRNMYLLWVIQDLSATLYPLVIRLHLMGWLPQRGVSSDARTLLELIELADLRVFKLRGTNPQADIFRITRGLPTLSLDQVMLALQGFCQHFMSDALMASRLVDEDLYRNPGLARMLIQEEEKARLAVGEAAMGLAKLAKLNQEGLTAEHILPQDPENRFDITGYGFGSPDEYLQHKHRLGNLVLLEGSINTACSNRTVETKMTSPDLYMASQLCGVLAVAARFTGNTQRFNRTAIDERSQRLAKLMVESWPIVVSAPPVATQNSKEEGVEVSPTLARDAGMLVA